jgi:hypothetical protein
MEILEMKVTLSQMKKSIESFISRFDQLRTDYQGIKTM